MHVIKQNKHNWLKTSQEKYIFFAKPSSFCLKPFSSRSYMISYVIKTVTISELSIQSIVSHTSTIKKIQCSHINPQLKETFQLKTEI